MQKEGLVRARKKGKPGRKKEKMALHKKILSSRQRSAGAIGCDWLHRQTSQVGRHSPSAKWIFQPWTQPTRTMRLRTRTGDAHRARDSLPKEIKIKDIEQTRRKKSANAQLKLNEPIIEENPQRIRTSRTLQTAPEAEKESRCRPQQKQNCHL
ncbi:hypothetical protein K438DRAFT_1784541 [Mycena galopus ATCC 62051]|nr:hypothetical protein K438DRAFT_1784541 [Mycena galopus ATCC 62051]